MLRNARAPRARWRESVPRYFRFLVNSKQSLQYIMYHSLLGYPRQLGGSVSDAVCLAICDFWLYRIIYKGYINYGN